MNTPAEAAQAAERIRAVLAEHIADGRLAAPYYAEADVVAVLDRLRQLEELLGIGGVPEQWDTIAEAEGRRYEAEQTNDTIVGYLAYRCEDLKAQRHVLLAELREREQERDEDTRAVRDAVRTDGSAAHALVGLGERWDERIVKLAARRCTAEHGGRLRVQCDKTAPHDGEAHRADVGGGYVAWYGPDAAELAAGDGQGGCECRGAYRCGFAECESRDEQDGA
jgi:hypothetical protein